MTGIDAYIQVSAAQAWLTTHVVNIAAWTANSASQVAALVEASDTIDALPLKGCKYADNITQPRAFPRIPESAAYGRMPSDPLADLYISMQFDWGTVPQEVLDACCLEALEILKQGSSGRRTLREQGVKSFSIGGKELSETFEDQALPKLLSQKARAKLSHWIAGVVEAV